MDLKEIRIQIVLGTVPEELRVPLLKGMRASVAISNRRKCRLCNENILKGEKYYDQGTRERTFNICNDCSYISIIRAAKKVGKEQP